MTDDPTNPRSNADYNVQDIVVSETCSKSENEWGTHHDDWYDDLGCPWCLTTEQNLAVFE